MKRPPQRRGDAVDELLEQLVLDERDGPASPLGNERALALVRRARERCAPVPPGKLLRFPKLPLIGIGVVVATSAAAAALGGFPRLLSLFSEAETPAEVREGAASEVHRSAKKQASKLATTPPAITPPRAVDAAGEEAPSGVALVAEGLVAEAPPDEAAPIEGVPVEEAPDEEAPLQGAPSAEAAIEPIAAEPSKPRPRARARAASIRAPVREYRSSAAITRELERDPVSAPDSAPAADLLGIANRARAERRYSSALDTYRRVIASFPDTRQAQIVRVSAGDLELERGDPRAAEQLFYKALRAADVGAEALFGLAEAYRAEARVVEERRALVLFGQRYPSNPLAAAARRRLSELGEAHAPK